MPAANWQEWLETAGRVAATFQANPNGAVPQQIWGEMAPWLSALGKNAAARWLPRMVASVPCQVPHLVMGVPEPCKRSAVSNCDICGRPTCLEHCRVDHQASAICFLCVAGASRAFKSSAGKVFFEGVHSSSGYGPQGQQAPGPQRDTKAELRAAYKLIGVKKSCEDAELKSAYRKLAMQWHPDRHQEPAAKAEAEEKFKKISAAYELIIKSREKGTA